jgi:hypothetical protein
LPACRAGRVPSLSLSRRKHIAGRSVVAPDQAAGQRERVERAERAVADFARGAFVIVFDDESRENEGDLMVAAEPLDVPMRVPGVRRCHASL